MNDIGADLSKAIDIAKPAIIDAEISVMFKRVAYPSKEPVICEAVPHRNVFGQSIGANGLEIPLRDLSERLFLLVHKDNLAKIVCKRSVPRAFKRPVCLGDATLPYFLEKVVERDLRVMTGTGRYVIVQIPPLRYHARTELSVFSLTIWKILIKKDFLFLEESPF